MEEGRIVDAEQAIKVRKSLATVTLTALGKLSKQLHKSEIVTEEWCKNLKIIGDQIRRDYHVPKESAPAPAVSVPTEVDDEAMDDPLHGLAIVSEDDEAA
ncbi:MAG: hypothetical protein ACO1RA_02235 [Planctomycetaceae bacterium]